MKPDEVQEFDNPSLSWITFCYKGVRWVNLHSGGFPLAGMINGLVENAVEKADSVNEVDSGIHHGIRAECRVMRRLPWG